MVFVDDIHDFTELFVSEMKMQFSQHETKSSATAQIRCETKQEAKYTVTNVLDIALFVHVTLGHQALHQHLLAFQVVTVGKCFQAINQFGSEILTSFFGLRSSHQRHHINRNSNSEKNDFTHRLVVLNDFPHHVRSVR